MLKFWKSIAKNNFNQLSLRKQQLKEEKQRLVKEKNHVEHVQQAQKIIQGVASEIQQRVHSQMSSIVTRCIETVYGKDSYEFKISFEQKRGKTEARLIFIKDGMELDPTDDMMSIGVVDLASFALRLSCLMIKLPKLRRVLILDEPMKFVDKQARPRIAELLETLAEELDMQFLIATHDSEFIIGKVEQVGLRTSQEES
jgi:DNA repair exonuclease SbcCD ATPase subunit